MGIDIELGKAEKKILLQVLSLSITYGVPAMMRAIQGLQKEVITEQDILNLQIEGHPGDPFPDGGGEER